MGSGVDLPAHICALVLPVSGYASRERGRHILMIAFIAGIRGALALEIQSRLRLVDQRLAGNDFDLSGSSEGRTINYLHLEV
jgi:hypothetical protein